jgi:hypothetical protein
MEGCPYPASRSAVTSPTGPVGRLEPCDCHLFGFLKRHTTGKEICSRELREASCHLLATDASQGFLLHLDKAAVLCCSNCLNVMLINYTFDVHSMSSI